MVLAQKILPTECKLIPKNLGPPFFLGGPFLNFFGVPPGVLEGVAQQLWDIFGGKNSQVLKGVWGSTARGGVGFPHTKIYFLCRSHPTERGAPLAGYPLAMRITSLAPGVSPKGETLFS